MSAAAPTRIFGFRVGIDPRFLLIGLVLLSVMIFLYNMRSPAETSANYRAPLTGTRPMSMGTAGKSQTNSSHRKSDLELRPYLKFRAIDGSQGDIDPRLRLDLLARLSRLPEPANKRSLFEVVSAPVAEIKGPIIVPRPLPPAPLPEVAAPPAEAPAAPFPLKYYGFLKSTGFENAKKGFFLDGDVVLIGAQGDLLEQRYKLIALTPTSAELEDIESAKSQTLAAPAEAGQ